MCLKRSTLIAAILAAAPAVSPAAVLYSENFDTDATENWSVNRVSAGMLGNAGDVYFDYSTVGIPSAPNSAGGSTRGLMLQANLPPTGVMSGISASPLGQSFTGNFTLRADVWQNFNGPLPAGGNGSTQVTWMGIGTNGTTPQFPGTSVQGVGFGSTGDGGTGTTTPAGTDYRAYTNTGAVLGPGSGVYAAGTQATATNNTDPYYAANGLGGEAAPPDQLALFPQQSGLTAPGTTGMAWHVWEVVKNENIVTWTVDGVLIATVDVTTEPFGGDNFFLGHFDINNASSSDPNAPALLFGLFDNVVVTDVIPEPGAASLLALGGVAAMRRRRRG